MSTSETSTPPVQETAQATVEARETHQAIAEEIEEARWR